MSSESTRVSLGEMIRRQRRIGALSMRQLSEMVGISNPYLSQIENGLRAPSEHVLRNIATSLGIPVEDLSPDHDPDGEGMARTRAAIKDDPVLSAAQRRSLLIVYESMIAARRGTELPEDDDAATVPPDAAESG